MRKKILIIDDDLDLCTLLGRFLSKNGYDIEMAHSGAKGIAKFLEHKFDMVICDYRLGDMEGIKVLKELRKENPAVKVLMITGYSDIKTAVEVIKLGAFDYIVKPLIPDEVLSVLNKAMLQPDAVRSKGGEPVPDTNKRKGPSKADYQNDEYMIGKAPATKALYEQINIVAGTNYSVILYGESGTG
ncbi:MAG: sigma-54-dependent transcriptional regulator, partial [Chitinophagaceae bacterium]